MGDASDLETGCGALGRESIKSGTGGTGALNLDVEETITQLEGDGDILRAASTMVKAEDTAQTIEIGHSSVATALESLAS
jgi:hypothetical protein